MAESPFSPEGKLALITGATGGLGFAAAEALAAMGVEVLLTGRDTDKGVRAQQAIRTRHPRALVRFELLDISSQGSIRRFLDRFDPPRRVLDILINNAGLMAPPTRQHSAEGVELQFATNYLGHFSLTAGLMPALVRSSLRRVVQVSSLMARRGRHDLATIRLPEDYQPMQAYADSKLAQLVFMAELQRRSERCGWGLTSVAAHPGIARSDLVTNGPGRESLAGFAYGIVEPLLSQPVDRAVRPIVRAATDPEVRPLDYFGPGGPFELWGAPGRVRLPDLARSEMLGARLWRLSEDLADTRFPILAAA